MSFALEVNNVSKRFEIPHLKINTLRGAFVNLFQKQSYEKFDALKDISFSVKKGEFFSIIGKNGSGKSTLLKIIAGIYTPDKGEVKVHCPLSPMLELGIGFNPELSGRDNVFVNGLVLGLSKKEISDKFKDIVAFAGLERFIDQRLKNYSSGMAARLAFSVMIHSDKDFLLIDEVLAVGDTEFQAKCTEYFIKAISEGKTIVFVSHGLDPVQQYSNRVMLLHKGEILEIGEPQKVIQTYLEKCN